MKKYPLILKIVKTNLMLAILKLEEINPKYRAGYNKLSDELLTRIKGLGEEIKDLEQYQKEIGTKKIL